MDALQIGKAILGGFDRGAWTADIIAALWPERCTARARDEKHNHRVVTEGGHLIIFKRRSPEGKKPREPRGFSRRISHRIFVM